MFINGPRAEGVTFNGKNSPDSSAYNLWAKSMGDYEFGKSATCGKYG